VYKNKIFSSPKFVVFRITHRRLLTRSNINCESGGAMGVRGGAVAPLAATCRGWHSDEAE